MEQTMTNESTTYRGILLKNEPMSKHTTWRVGGMADNFYRPADIEDLCSFLQSLPVDEPVFWLGLGSNLLIRDKGIRGTVICTSGVLNNIHRVDEHRIYVECGVASPKLARFCAKEGLTGMEFLCGIPGTWGGALAMNAGALGGETWDIVDYVETVDRQGNRYKRSRDEFVTGYRNVKGQDNEWFVSAVIKLKAGNKETSLLKIKEYLARRGSTQPTQQPNAGSVFRNPENDYAARLIEEAGLKNICVGGACVSTKHANFIINTGHATASDIENLISKVQQKVKEIYNVELIREVQIVGSTNDE